MTALALMPALVVLALGVMHIGYYRRNLRRSSQQVITLPNLLYRSPRGAARFAAARQSTERTLGRRLAGVFETLADGRARQPADAELFKPFASRLSGLGKRVVLEGDTRIADERHVDTLVCTGDLLIEGNCVFLSPVKVLGDLTVTGNVAFLKTVIVNGNATVSGLGAIFAGMVVKGELAVPGRLMVGDSETEGWVAAGDVNVDGNLLLNGHIDVAADDPTVPFAIDPFWRTILVPCAIAVAGWFAAGPIGAWAANTIVGRACHAVAAGVTCDYPPVAVGFTTAEALLGATLAVVLAVTWRWFRTWMAYPFIAVMSVLGLFAVGYDAIVGLPVVGETRIVNDTMNVLQAIILASFVLTFLVLRRLTVPLPRVAVAVALSFGAKTGALIAFLFVQRAIGGAAELLLLFALYAFGAFSLHLMTIAGLVRHARAPSRMRTSVPVRASQARSSAIEGLRGLAISLVVIYHYVPPELFSFNLGKPINSILFVVAGFFFAAALDKQRAVLEAPVAQRVRALGDLLVRRHMRTWPLLAIVVALYLGLSVIDDGALTQQIRTTWPYYLTYLGYLPRWALEAQAFPGHLWVVSAQETVIVALCAAIVFAGLPRVRALLWGVVIVGIVSRMYGTMLFMPLHPSMALETPLAVLDPFAIGMLTRFGLDQRARQSRLRRQIVLALTATIVLWAILPNWNTTYFTLAPLIATLATALVMVFSVDRVRGRRMGSAGLGHPVLVALGKISFPLFLLHPFVNTLLRLGFTASIGFEMPWQVLFLIGPPLSALAAWALHRAVDGRLRRASQAFPGWPARVAEPVEAPVAAALSVDPVAADVTQLRRAA